MLLSLFYAGGQGGNYVATSLIRMSWIGKCSSLFSFNSHKVECNKKGNICIQHSSLTFEEGTHTIAYSSDRLLWRGLGKTIFTSYRKDPFKSTGVICWTGLGKTIFSSKCLKVTYNRI